MKPAQAITPEDAISSTSTMAAISQPVAVVPMGTQADCQPEAGAQHHQPGAGCAVTPSSAVWAARGTQRQGRQQQPGQAHAKAEGR